ncbi:MAG: ribbon-helix-helix domain-containing protein [Patescibacteria group bacterium]
MTTFSISLPNQIAVQVDSETQRQGFATRSEFIRTLLRKYFTQELPFVPFTPRPLNEIKLELAKTGKYSQEFIESVVKGLSKSSFYAR